MWCFRVVLLISLTWGLVVSASVCKTSPVLRIDNGPGNYTFMYKVNDNIYRVERGMVQESDDGKMHLVLIGAVSYMDDNDKKHVVQYIRNGNEFEQNDVQELTPELATIVESSDR